MKSAAHVFFKRTFSWCFCHEKNAVFGSVPSTISSEQSKSGRDFGSVGPVRA